jgi:hypothetical protein
MGLYLFMEKIHNFSVTNHINEFIYCLLPFQCEVMQKSQRKFKRDDVPLREMIQRRQTTTLGRHVYLMCSGLNGFRKGYNGKVSVLLMSDSKIVMFWYCYYEIVKS